MGLSEIPNIWPFLMYLTADQFLTSYVKKFCTCKEWQRRKEEKKHLIRLDNGEGLKFLETCKAYRKTCIHALILFHSNSSDLCMLSGFFLCNQMPSNGIPRQYFFKRVRHFRALYADLSVPTCITISPGLQIVFFFILKSFTSVSFYVDETQNQF